jgi:hypothetical protein
VQPKATALHLDSIIRVVLTGADHFRYTPDERTSSEPVGMSQTCTISDITYAPQSITSVARVAQEKTGRTVICRAQYHRVNAVIAFLREHCCEGFESDLPAAAARRAS